jgi:hypothetical protein
MVSIDRTFGRQLSKITPEHVRSCDKVKEHLIQFAASSGHASLRAREDFHVIEF